MGMNIHITLNSVAPTQNIALEAFLLEVVSEEG